MRFHFFFLAIYGFLLFYGTKFYHFTKGKLHESFLLFGVALLSEKIGLIKKNYKTTGTKLVIYLKRFFFFFVCGVIYDLCPSHTSTLVNYPKSNTFPFTYINPLHFFIVSSFSSYDYLRYTQKDNI